MSSHSSRFLESSPFAVRPPRTLTWSAGISVRSGGRACHKTDFILPIRSEVGVRDVIHLPRPSSVHLILIFGSPWPSPWRAPQCRVEYRALTRNTISETLGCIKAVDGGPKSTVTMFAPALRSQLFLHCLYFLPTVLGAIGPSADLVVSNANVSPDGFNRVGTVINGKVDTTLITAQKVPRFLIFVLVDLLNTFHRDRGFASTLSIRSATQSCTRLPPSYDSETSLNDCSSFSL